MRWGRRAVAQMLADGRTLDGAAAALGWNRPLVGARAKILELPEAAQQQLDTGALPVRAIDTLLAIAAVSSERCAALVAAVGEGDVTGAQPPSVLDVSGKSAVSERVTLNGE